MENKTAVRAFVPLTIAFVITSAALLLARAWLQQRKIDADILIIGNIVLFGATAASFFVHFRALNNKNTQAFLRALYGSMLIRMMICLLAVLVYISIVGNAVNKTDVFGFMFLYFVYTFTEVAILMKLSKQNKNV